jgi:hypothetical protein
MDRQEEITKRIQAELGNLVVQLTVKNIEIEALQKENAELMRKLDSMRPESGQHKGGSNGN